MLSAKKIKHFFINNLIIMVIFASFLDYGKMEELPLSKNVFSPENNKLGYKTYIHSIYRLHRNTIKKYSNSL